MREFEGEKCVSLELSLTSVFLTLLQSQLDASKAVVQAGAAVAAATGLSHKVLSSLALSGPRVHANE